MLRRVATMLVAALVSLGGVVVVANAPASAAEVCHGWVTTSGGRAHYGVIPCPGADTPPDDDGGSGGGGPSCHVGRDDQDYEVSFCRGDLTCYRQIPSSIYDTPDTWPARPPSAAPEAVYSWEACFSQPPAEEMVTDEYLWLEPEGPTLAEQAAEAYGELDAPAFRIGFNPPGRAVVSIPTWFWAEGPSDAPLHGSSAAGLVAIATPDRLDIDPGDGSGVRECPFSVAATEACSVTYDRSSVRGGGRTAAGTPAYVARARLVYEVAFEMNGAPVTIPGTPDEFPSLWQEQLVPVAEVESLTTIGK